MKNHLLLIFLSVVLQITVSESTRYMGCYKDFSIESRLMIGEYNRWMGSITTDKCINHCQSNGFSYAGTQTGAECFCSHVRPSFKYSADESDCNMACQGDKSKICGGPWRLSVYDIQDKGQNYVDSNYKGCYVDSADRMLPKRAPDSLSNTPELCVAYCYRNGYRFSGIEMGKECYCGDELKGSPVIESQCNARCPGDSRFFCGGGWRLSIYATSISDESETGHFVGCFVDNTEKRLLSGYNLTLPETNSPRRCMNICLQLGFDFAGVENGVQCGCGSRRPEKEKEKAENECAWLCPDGVTRACGGWGRLSVYSTFTPPNGNNSPGFVNGGRLLKMLLST